MLVILQTDSGYMLCDNGSGECIQLMEVDPQERSWSLDL